MNRIKELRQNRGWRQADLADLLSTKPRLSQDMRQRREALTLKRSAGSVTSSIAAQTICSAVQIFPAAS